MAMSRAIGKTRAEISLRGLRAESSFLCLKTGCGVFPPKTHARSKSHFFDQSLNRFEADSQLFWMILETPSAVG